MAQNTADERAATPKRIEVLQFAETYGPLIKFNGYKSTAAMRKAAKDCIEFGWLRGDIAQARITPKGRTVLAAATNGLRSAAAGRIKLTEAQRCYLRCAAEMGAISDDAVSGNSRKCVDRLVARGLLSEIDRFGKRFDITDAGRAALAAAKTGGAK